MLGIGVAFLAIPILSFGSNDLVGSIQPLALLLNGVSALFAASAFAATGHLEWRKALLLSTTMSIAAPFGALTARYIAPVIIWIMFYFAVAMVLWLLFKPRRVDRAADFERTLVVSVPVSYLCSVLGVGPGFVMVLLLIRAGHSVRSAAAINAVAVVPSSFAAFGMHLYTGARIDASASPVVAIAAVASLAGGYLASRHVNERPLRIIFAATIIGLCGYKSLGLLRPPALVVPAALARTAPPLQVLWKAAKAG